MIFQEVYTPKLDAVWYQENILAGTEEKIYWSDSFGQCIGANSIAINISSFLCPDQRH